MGEATVNGRTDPDQAVRVLAEEEFCSRSAVLNIGPGWVAVILAGGCSPDYVPTTPGNGT